MAVTYKQLLHHCVTLVKGFDPDTQALDIYVSDYLQSHELHEDDATFIMEVFSGIFRYPGIIRVIMDAFFAKVGHNVTRREQPLFEVLTYLVLFRLQEVGVANYREMIMCHDVNKMYKLTNFLFDEKNIVTWMKCEWMKLYDQSFVDDHLLAPLLRELPELQKIVKTLRLTIDNEMPMKKEEKPATEVKPFNLTKVKPRKVPLPEVIPQVLPHKPAPQSTYYQPREFSKLTKVKETNRRKAEVGLMFAEQHQVRCANTNKSVKTKAKMRAIEKQRYAECDFDGFRAQENPKFDGKDVSFKLNTASILREGNVYKQRQEKTIKELNDLEAGCSDISRFLQWQTDARQKDTEESLAQIERKRYAGKLSYEEAILARQKVFEINKVKAQEMKQQASDMMNEYLANRLKEEKTMRQLVEETAAGHKNAKEAKMKLQLYKHKLVQEMNEEMKEMMRQALEQAEKEMLKKMELINEIRTLESNPVIRLKLVDLASTPGHGFLNEMSIVELRERLSLMKTRMQMEEEKKRDEIINEKAEKNQNLIDTLGMISKHRDEMARAMVKQSEKKNSQRFAPKKSEQAQEFERILAEKRATRKEKQAKNILVPGKMSNIRVNDLQTQREEMERLRWKELEVHNRRVAKLTSQGFVGNKSRDNRLAVPSLS